MFTDGRGRSGAIQQHPVPPVIIILTIIIIAFRPIFHEIALKFLIFWYVMKSLIHSVTIIIIIIWRQY